MSSYTTRFILVLAGLFLLPSCTARYQQMLRDRDMKIKELNAQNAELSAANQELDGRYKGASARVASLEEKLKARKPSGSSDLEDLKKALGKDVDVDLRGNRLSLGINNRVTFASGSRTLKSSAHSVLRRVAQVLQEKFPGRRVVIEGHTDTDPIRKTKNLFRDNKHLAFERADAVANYLIKSCNVPASRVVVASYGQWAPLASGSSKSAKERNRRVEIVVGATL